ncbi:MAG: hypothetical protein KDA74_10195, partial [Planctomycetaceae bacterium]|nr:hypothetical protein [Planctomycetaceae bacterium]
MFRIKVVSFLATMEENCKGYANFKNTPKKGENRLKCDRLSEMKSRSADCRSHSWMISEQLALKPA